MLLGVMLWLLKTINKQLNDYNCRLKTNNNNNNKQQQHAAWQRVLG
jgi:hypothetical protein